MPTRLWQLKPLKILTRTGFLVCKNESPSSVLPTSAIRTFRFRCTLITILIYPYYAEIISQRKNFFKTAAFVIKNLCAIIPTLLLRVVAELRTKGGVYCDGYSYHGWRQRSLRLNRQLHLASLVQVSSSRYPRPLT